jgi:hypothetical protein
MNFGGGGGNNMLFEWEENDCLNLAYHLNMDLYTMNKTIQTFECVTSHKPSNTNNVVWILFPHFWVLG